MRIPIVNEQDEIIGHKDREDINSEDIVRATGLWVRDKNKNILLAQRSFTKKFGPGLWGPSAGGVVEEDESCELCIIREAEEELGLKGVIFNIGPKIRLFNCFGYFFSATVDSNYKFVKQDEEVEQIKWFSEEELNKILKEKPEIFMSNFENNYKEFLQYENKN
jgi:isopentenyldiphosphate isomerase